MERRRSGRSGRVRRRYRTKERDDLDDLEEWTDEVRFSPFPFFSIFSFRFSIDFPFFFLPILFLVDEHRFGQWLMNIDSILKYVQIKQSLRNRTMVDEQSLRNRTMFHRFHSDNGWWTEFEKQNSMLIFLNIFKNRITNIFIWTGWTNSYFSEHISVEHRFLSITE